MALVALGSSGRALAGPTPCDEVLLSAAPLLAGGPLEPALALLNGPQCAGQERAAVVRGLLLLDARKPSEAAAAVRAVRTAALQPWAQGIAIRAGAGTPTIPQIPPAAILAQARAWLADHHDDRAADAVLALVRSGWRCPDPRQLEPVDRAGELLAFLEPTLPAKPGDCPPCYVGVATAWADAALTRAAGFEHAPDEHARVLVTRLLEEIAPFPEALELAAHLAERLGFTVEAESHWARVRAAMPQNAEVAALHSHALLVLGRTQEAIAAATEAVRMDPQNGHAAQALGRAYAEAGNPGAIEAFRRAKSAGMDSAELSFQLGQALERAGRTDEAMKAYRDAVVADSDLVSARFRLAGLLRRAGDPSAQAMAEDHERTLARSIEKEARSQRLDTALACLHDTLAAADAGRVPEARHTLAGCFPELPAALRALANVVVEVRAGNTRGARKAALELLAAPKLPRTGG